MNLPLVMTIIGPDRTGLVERLASIVAEHDGNWLESQMSHLGGHFAGLLRIQIPADKEPDLRRALEALEAQGLKIVAHADPAPQPRAEGAQVVLEIVGQDRPGIVRQISSALAKHGANVETLNTECLSAPMSGETLFKAEARLHIPASSNVAELRKDLEKIAHDLMADLVFGEVSAGITPTAT